MPSGDALKVGVSGLQVFQRSLNTIGHNISNSQTDGYSRQRVELAQRNGTPSGGGFIGNGVESTSIKRLFDQHTIDQVRSRTATTEYFSTFNEFASQVDNLVADPDAGLSPAIESFFKSVQQVADDPTSIPARDVMHTQGETLTERFATMQSWFGDIQDAVNDHIVTQVSVVNRLASSIADLNQQIIVAQGLSAGQPPNDLLDKRDNLIDDLSKNLNVNVLEKRDGTVDVFVGNGQSLVLGVKSMQLQARSNPDDPSNMEVVYKDPSTSLLSPISNMLSGGNLGGVLRFREEILMPSINGLGRLAIAVTATFNDQHEKGMDLQNNTGISFFNEPQLTAQASSRNTGGVNVSIALNNVNDLTADEYQLTFNGGNYLIRNTATNEVFNPGVAVAGPPTTLNTFKGLDITLDGVPNASDVFYIRPTRDAARQLSVAIIDSNQIAAASPLRSNFDVAGNLGTGKITQPIIVDSTNPNLSQQVTIIFKDAPGGAASPATANAFDVIGAGTGNPVDIAYTAGGDIIFNGWKVQITGDIKVGDSFTVSPNTTGFSDNRNALALVDLQVSGTMIGGNATYQDAYSDIVVSVGNKTNQSEISMEAQGALLAQAQESRDAISGVNLDEEAANLIRYQQAYAAAAQVISIASGLFDTLLTAVRR